ncbi:isocitrate lyase/PEP mutase family protein [Parasphingorhabdus sp.]|uniref:isocitrate lyase/PEP mutase family protein n=1 Tax=Parasphingorhabdus sp. TaxID=2709688 RepID=UPI003A91FCEA
MNQIAKFAALHIPGDPLILVNIWDAGSTRAVAAAGAKAIATGSYGVAGAQGMDDGENFPIDAAIANLEQIVAVTDLPVSIDMEAGYGDDPGAVEQSVARAKVAGACGINIEDRMPGENILIPLSEQCKRLEAAANSGLFINARCDVFRGATDPSEFSALVAEVLKRGADYARSGASGLFVPFLSDRASIGEICAKSELPVNILRSPDGPSHAELRDLGVARISHGHQPWAAAMRWLKLQAGTVFGGGEPDY